MKRFYTLVINLLCVSFFSFSFGQESDYNILLHSGSFLPAENKNSLDKSSELFQKSQFADKYYIVVQFNNLPTESEKIQLKALGITLIDYIPNLAYTASVDRQFSISQLQQFDIRSVFQFNN